MKNIKDTVIAFAVILIIGSLMVVAFDYLGNNPSKNDCVIGRDSPDCLEGGGSGHPLWNN